MIRLFAKIAFMTYILKLIEEQHLRKRADLIVLQYKQLLEVSCNIFEIFIAWSSVFNFALLNFGVFSQILSILWETRGFFLATSLSFYT